jgi:FkbM family methyltransferase
MMNYHSRPALAARWLARRIGVLGPLKRLLFAGRSYEDTFHTRMRALIGPGDVVWDVGANVGLYTTRFAEWVGRAGRVVAFEPLPPAAAALEKAIAALPESAASVEIVRAALSDRPGETEFAFDDAESGSVTTTGHLAEGARTGADGKRVSVIVRTADEVVASGAPQPTVVKIDVEGYEEEVLLGGNTAFGAAACRELFIEVHFTRLDERGRGDAVARMVARMKSWGYQIEWLDPSHVHAYRANR